MLLQSLVLFLLCNFLVRGILQSKQTHTGSPWSHQQTNCVTDYKHDYYEDVSVRLQD